MADKPSTPLDKTKAAFENLRAEHPYIFASAGAGLMIGGSFVIIPALGVLALNAIGFTSAGVAGGQHLTPSLLQVTHTNERLSDTLRLLRSRDSVDLLSRCHCRPFLDASICWCNSSDARRWIHCGRNICHRSRCCFVGVWPWVQERPGGWFIRFFRGDFRLPSPALSG